MTQTLEEVIEEGWRNGLLEGDKVELEEIYKSIADAVLKAGYTKSPESCSQCGGKDYSGDFTNIVIKDRILSDEEVKILRIPTSCPRCKTMTERHFVGCDRPERWG